MKNPTIEVFKKETPQEVPIFEGGQIAKAPQEAISAPSGGGTQDTEARTAISSILTTLRELGFIRQG